MPTQSRDGQIYQQKVDLFLPLLHNIDIAANKQGRKMYYTEQTGALQEWGIFDVGGTLLAYVKTPMEADILLSHLNRGEL